MDGAREAATDGARPAAEGEMAAEGDTATDEARNDTPNRISLRLDAPNEFGHLFRFFRVRTAHCVSLRSRHIVMTIVVG